jgi:hypothetical protein
VLVPKTGIASPLLLPGVPESKAGKNRMHLDIVVDDIGAEVDRPQELGAHRIDEGVQSFGGTRWVRRSDPEQNEFCVSTGVEWEGSSRGHAIIGLELADGCEEFGVLAGAGSGVIPATSANVVRRP